MSDHGDHGHGGHDDGHGAPAAPEVPAEARPVLQGVGIGLVAVGTVLLSIFVQG